MKRNSLELLDINGMRDSFNFQLVSLPLPGGVFLPAYACLWLSHFITRLSSLKNLYSIAVLSDILFGQK